MFMTFVARESIGVRGLSVSRSCRSSNEVENRLDGCTIVPCESISSCERREVLFEPLIGVVEQEGTLFAWFVVECFTDRRVQRREQRAEQGTAIIVIEL